MDNPFFRNNGPFKFNEILNDLNLKPDEKNKDLSDAQNKKYQKLIDLIKPRNGDKILEIGCGWGGFAEYLGKKYDVKLDCITISKKQFEYAKERIFNCGLNGKVNIEIKDYRDLKGKYNSIAVFALYEASGLPVVPVALNSGHVWPRNSWMKYPGLVTVEFLDPIDPGLNRKSFMATLKQRIEDRVEILDAPYVKNQEKA